MKYELEQYLFEQIKSGQKPRTVIARMLEDGIIESPKQAWRTLEKWSDKGLYDYGVTLDLGWLTTDKLRP